MSATRFQADLPVLATRRLGADLHWLALALPGRDPLEVEFRAGMFAQLAVPGLALPRPFSILRAAPGRLEFLVKVVGPGTHHLADAPVGATIPALWPLGRGFLDRLGEEDPGERWLLVGGGVGIAPLIALKEQAAARPRVDLLFGHRDRASAEAAAWFHPDTPARISTEDGSLGLAGRVTALLEQALEEGGAGRIFCCGPEPMMEAVAELARQRELPCLLSLETLMGCGIGICVGCAVPRTGGGFALACQEGPVFPREEVAGHELAAPACACAAYPGGAS